MSLPVYVVDAFTDEPFRGNPAGVCLLDAPLADDLMQRIAMEMNHAETAFPLKIGEGRYSLRWFTPMQEVPMCGHATLATSHILWTTGKETNRIVYETQAGELTAQRESELIVLDFPSMPVEPVSDSQPFAKALRAHPEFVGTDGKLWMVEFASEELIRNFEPDFAAIAGLGRDGVIVTAKSDSESDDFVSRFFAPNIGINEDPVTGGAHCYLAPYWSQKLGKTQMVGYQASARGGYVRVESLGARVLLKGQAVTTLAGQFSGSIL